MVRLRDHARPTQRIRPARQPSTTARTSTAHLPRRRNPSSSADAISQKHRLSRYHSTHQGVCHRAFPRKRAMP